MTIDHILDKNRPVENWADIVDDLLRDSFYARTRLTQQRKPSDGETSDSRENSREIAALLPRSIRI